MAFPCCRAGATNPGENAMTWVNRSPLVMPTQAPSEKPSRNVIWVKGVAAERLRQRRIDKGDIGTVLTELHPTSADVRRSRMSPAESARGF